MQLVIGPRAYSTWSLRGWLAMKATGADFDVIDVEYRTEAQRAALRRISPSGLVPVLKVDGEMIWDTLSIAEWAAERFPEAGLWPKDAAARALARSVTAEMHSGFPTLRILCGTGPDHPMVGEARAETPSDPALDRELARLTDVFRRMRGRYGDAGPWLFGARSIADIFYTPVAARFRHFQIDPARHGDDGTASAYLETLLRHPHFLEWSAEAARRS